MSSRYILFLRRIWEVGGYIFIRFVEYGRNIWDICKLKVFILYMSYFLVIDVYWVLI